MVVYLSAADRVVSISVITTLRRAATNATTNTITNICLGRLWVIQLCTSGVAKGGVEWQTMAGGGKRNVQATVHSSSMQLELCFPDGRLFIRHRTLKIGMSLVLIACLFRTLQGSMPHTKGCNG